MAVVWAVPCGATFAVIPTLATAFFGWGGMLVMVLIFAIMFVLGHTGHIPDFLHQPKDQIDPEYKTKHGNYPANGGHKGRLDILPLNPWIINSIFMFWGSFSVYKRL